MDLPKLLRGVELFEGLDETQLKQVADIGELMTVNKGAVIFSQGEPGENLYIVGEGQVQVQFEEATFNPISQVFLGRGQIFGEIALIDRGGRSATMVCMRDDTLLLKISREDFTALCESDKGIGYVVMRNIAADLSFKLRHRNLSSS